MHERTHTHVYAWACVCMGVCMDGRVYAWACICMGVCMHGPVYAWACVCMGVYMHGRTHINASTYNIPLWYKSPTFRTCFFKYAVSMYVHLDMCVYLSTIHVYMSPYVCIKTYDHGQALTYRNSEVAHVELLLDVFLELFQVRQQLFVLANGSRRPDGHAQRDATLVARIPIVHVCVSVLY